jgi:hypothetical protein
MKLKECSFCGKQGPIYKNLVIDSVRYKACKSCTFIHDEPKPINKVSEKQKIKNKEYSLLRIKHLLEYPNCQINLPGCTTFATDIHHVEGRGINTTNAETFKSSCRFCHTKIHAQLSREERNELGV